MRNIVCMKALRSPSRGFEPCARRFVPMASLGLGFHLLLPRSELDALRGSCSHPAKHNGSQECVDMARRAPARRPASPVQPLACLGLTSRSWGPAGRKSRRVQCYLFCVAHYRAPSTRPTSETKASYKRTNRQTAYHEACGPRMR